MKHTTRFAIASALATAGFTSSAHASIDHQFVCEAQGDVDILVVISAQDSSNAMVQFSSGDGTEEGEPTPEPMRQIPAGSGIKYAGVGVIFHAKGNEGILQTEAGSVMCSSPDGETDAAAEAQSLEARAWSYGGVVRAGPGMGYDRVTSLREGDPVTLLNNTGERMNGYDWFFIRLPDGTEAYQWGGILCSDALHIIGLYGDRDCPVGK